ncbi:hypothetical protein QWM81_22385 [Streptomyces ficellus]|uniref:Uncharacterized protein n=1 Tax=Streptomyces ficellus TaxID=1977088 RepID=A0ABT7ZB66_9ACTN|nr:hypothetical protein [Streptomyces ficellus]MDN3296744.1 hypothetical protein [Streptomyces ficellus]
MRFTGRPGAGRRAAAAGPALCALLIAPATTGCSQSGPPAPHSGTPADICTSLVSHWAKQAIDDSSWAGLDWEQKGLSNEQLTIHDDVVAAARAAERREGREAAIRLIDRRARQRCEAANGATGSSQNWRPTTTTVTPPPVTTTERTPSRRNTALPIRNAEEAGSPAPAPG